VRPMRVLVGDGALAVAAAVEDVVAEPVASADRPVAEEGSTERRRERLAARALLRRLVAEVAGADAAETPLAADARGKPFLVGRPDVAVSLSHSDGWVAAAARTGGGAVGVDVQVSIPDGERLMRRCCRPTTRSRLARLSPVRRALELAWIWSVQEACVKAQGTGIAGLPWTIPVQVEQRHGRWKDVSWVALRDELPVPWSCAVTDSAEVPS
jgi:4'-phosphopantetheinyl transferase